MTAAIYLGAQERIYPAVSVPGPDGSVTLIARPGMDPVDLDELPTDGLWARPDTSARQPVAEVANEQPTKARKAVSS